MYYAYIIQEKYNNIIRQGEIFKNFVWLRFKCSKQKYLIKQ